MPMRLVLLPGMDGTGQLFGPLVEHLGADVAVQVVSYPCAEARSYRDLEDSVRSALPADEPYVLVAESFSGPIAIRLAADGCGQALVLCASFATGPVPAGLRGLLRLVARPWLFRRGLPRWLLSVLLLGPRCPPPLLLRTASAIRSVSPPVMAHRVREILAVDVRQELRAVQMPVLYLSPRHDRLLGRQPHRPIEGLSPAVQVEVRDGPHLLLQRRPRESAAAIRAFLAARLGSPAWS